MDTIKVAWMSKAKAKKLSVSIPWGSLHVSTLQGGGGGLLSHSMLRIKSLLIFQEAHSPILPFAHLLLFHSSSSPSFCPLSFFPLPRMNFVAPNREKPAERISLFSFATLLSSKNIYDHSSLLSLFPIRTRVSNHASFHDRFQYDFINPCICWYWLMISGSPSCLRRVCCETLLIDAGDTYIYVLSKLNWTKGGGREENASRFYSFLKTLKRSFAKFLHVVLVE